MVIALARDTTTTRDRFLIPVRRLFPAHATVLTDAKRQHNKPRRAAHHTLLKTMLRARKSPIKEVTETVSLSTATSAEESVEEGREMGSKNDDG